MDEREKTTSRLKFGLRTACLILEGEIYGVWVPRICITAVIGVVVVYLAV